MRKAHLVPALAVSAQLAALPAASGAIDTDIDGYSDSFETSNSFDPLDPHSNPLVVFHSDFSNAGGFVDGNLSGQLGWLGQTTTQVETATATISNSGVGYIRNAHGAGALGSTGGDPGTAVRTFMTDDILSIEFDYQFTLPPSVNVNMANVGIRGETANNWTAVQGFKLAYNQFSAASGGSVKFWPDRSDTANADALIIDGALLGLNAAGDPGVGDGTADFESDDIRVAYTARCTDAATQAWEVIGFTVTNLTTAQTWDYSGPAQTFTYDDDGGAVPATPVEAFLAQQLAPNGNAGFVGRSGRALFRYASGAIDNDSDGLTQAEEFALGTSDGEADSDGDTFSDEDEVYVHGTDPLDNTSYPDSPEVASDDFSTYSAGTTPSTSDWSTKWDGSNPSQRNLWSVGATNGVDGGQGYGLDVTKAWRNYHTVNQTPVAGDVVILESDFQFATTGAALNESGTGGINGVNDRFIGLAAVATDNAWWQVNGSNSFTFSVCRRADDNFGFFVGNSLTGWVSNSAIGLDPGLTPSTSGWFKLRIEISETSPGSGTMQAVCKASYNGSVFFTSDPTALPAAFDGTNDVYGMLTNSYNTDPSNDTAAPIDPLDAAPATPVGDLAKISALATDNFSSTGYSASVDIDGDTLSQAEEALLGTSDLLTDTDGDGFSDDAEITAGTDPLDENDFPVVVTVDPEVTLFQFVDADTIQVDFTGSPSASYKLTYSPDLATPFSDTGLTTAADGSGVGSFTFDLPLPVSAKGFFRVEDN
ncbi:RHS repeat-associated core domain-containing protein [Haloferula helveola]|uniref:RHS repeat-associated core domain-containing protein n=1 Tax=Haloferula helveola TaxID=490095 RepID=A0ABM7R6P9_9BACT|nr:RHS repeat-associated core domain-containing protein [Haloferula helveola]